MKPLDLLILGAAGFAGWWLLREARGGLSPFVRGVDVTQAAGQLGVTPTDSGEPVSGSESAGGFSVEGGPTGGGNESLTPTGDDSAEFNWLAQGGDAELAVEPAFRFTFAASGSLTGKPEDSSEFSL